MSQQQMPVALDPLDFPLHGSRLIEASAGTGKTFALAGLVTASAEYLGPHAGPLRDGLKSLQLAFREASAEPEEPGHGPGEKYTGPVW